MKIRLMTAFALAVLAVACGEDNPVRPTASPSAHYIAGTVTEPVGIPIQDYSLRVLDSEGPHVFRVPGSDYRTLVQAGPVTIEVTKDGYQTRTVSLDVHAFTRQDIEIEPATSPAVFTGPFWMTLSADPAACGSLPTELRTRRYAVDVEQAGGALIVHMSDPKLTDQKVDGRIQGDALSFYLWEPDSYYGIGKYSLEEKLDDTSRLFIVGAVHGTVKDGGAAGQLSGKWTLKVDSLATTCEGVHGVRFDRR